MNDRFKFRVWIKYAELYYGLDSFYYDRLKNKYTFHFEDGHTKTIKEKDCVVEQCTGLKDKNGRLIYEGDILRLCEATYPAVIYWDGTSWCAMVNGKRKDLLNEFSYRVCGIVGNIHENPELVEA